MNKKTTLHKKTKEKSHAIKEKEQRQETKEGLLNEEKVPFNPDDMREKPAPTYSQRIAESRKVLEQPLAPGQKLFETPDGEVLVGEVEKDHVWSRTMNDGKGGWANPRR